MKKSYLYLLFFLVLCFSCRTNEEEHGLIYDGDGSAEVKPGGEVTITNTQIENRLDVKGDAVLEGFNAVGSDLESFPDGNITVYDSLSVNNNINVKGNMLIVGSVYVGTDFTQFPNSKVIIETSNDDNVLVIENNLNIQDSFLVRKGIVIVRNNLNLVGDQGIINISDGAQFIVEHDFVQSSVLYGRRNLSVEGTFKDENPEQTYDAPLY